VFGHGFDVAIYLFEKSEDKLSSLNFVNREGLDKFQNNLLDVLGNPEDRVNNQDSTGNTPLHLASQFNYGGYVEWLLGKKALPSKTNSDNETAWEVAVKCSACDAIGAFAFEEMKLHRNTHRSDHIGIPFFYSNGEGILNNGMHDWIDNTWHHFGGGNNVSRTLGQFAQA
jgi:hypothetical protein